MVSIVEAAQMACPEKHPRSPTSTYYNRTTPFRALKDRQAPKVPQVTQALQERLALQVQLVPKALQGCKARQAIKAPKAQRAIKARLALQVHQGRKVPQATEALLGLVVLLVLLVLAALKAQKVQLAIAFKAHLVLLVPSALQGPMARLPQMLVQGRLMGTGSHF
mmetsp:Transcript_43463/g.68891  ORF Transcript_43463/g.68891 Transcript_43463/m.68891 type:complete len:165 (-) Transcript_43463:472-966(-)